MKLNIKAFSIAIMFFYAVIILIFGLWHAATGFGKEFIKVFESLHPNFTRINFDPTVSTFASIGKNFFAIIINIIWSLIDGLIIGISVAGVYNFLVVREQKKKEKEQEAKNV